ncbi:PucR family transcriptional regulator [Buchananella hordeovulneris]|uniref:PucR family transcriptional regulator n=1 Tax=Buchananella hordeovulneris TaxID=52770 RepID=UPI0026DC30EA|nr:helix-turn-helix domain-containing protein [Buchananella hordeovulneris]MDO5080337.1 helix-turn-helix domain-containing protein [Buchananella hordeovulneris]
MHEPDATSRTHALHRLRASADTLTNAALKKIEHDLPWYSQLGAQDRSWISVVARTGINSFTRWFEDQGQSSSDATEIFNVAPRELARSIPLQHTLALIRIVVDVVATEAVPLVPESARTTVHDAVLVYARDVAFSAAEAYARAAEQRGAWDARLEALVVDCLVRGERDASLYSHLAALGWDAKVSACAVVGSAALAEAAMHDIRRAARKACPTALVGLYGSLALVLLGGTDPRQAATQVAAAFPSRTVIGPVVADVADAGRSVRAAVAGLTAVEAWPGAPDPASSSDLLPERVLAGDELARAEMREQIYVPLLAAGRPLVDTVHEYLTLGRSLEGAARSLFIHPNTVRYRLRRVAQLIGWDPTDAREGYVLQIALAVGRLDEVSKHTASPAVCPDPPK